MTDTEEGAARPAYLIVLRHVLVAQDIAMTLSDADPGARIVSVGSTAEAASALRDVARLAVAFVAEAPGAYAASDLAQAVAARGGRVVLIGQAAEAEGAEQGFAVLARPFSTDDILSHLAGGTG